MGETRPNTTPKILPPVYLSPKISCYNKKEVIILTIKRRLFISNILMIALPIGFTIVMFFALYSVFVGITGTNPLEIGQNRNIILTDEPTAAALMQHTPHTAVATATVYQAANGAYLLVLPEIGVQFRQQPLHLPAVMFFALLTIIFAVNRLLTKYISRHIMTAIDTLVGGVGEIRDGNLQFRFQHAANDEFDSVRNAFNEMAERLHAMVAAKQQDERNRKELIAGISHDLRTPLTSIKTYVEGIELGLATTPTLQQEYFATIKAKADDIEHIIKQLFLFSKLDIGEFPMQMSQSAVGEWLSEFVDAVSEEYRRKGLTISLDENTQNAHFSVDSVQLRSVFINILENALKYGNQEGGVMQIVSRKSGADIEISLTDNGGGVPSEFLGNLFDIFYRADKARNNAIQGSGLGLAISAKILERLGGGISAENAPHGGLSIIIRLPTYERGK